VLELIAAGAPLREVLTRVAVSLEELIEDSSCSILLLDPTGAALHHGAAPSLPATYSADIDGIVIGPDSGSCGAAAYLGMPVVAEDIASDPRWVGFREIARPHGLRSCWSSPIRGCNGTVGTFAVYHHHPHRPPLREQRLVERFTHLSGVAIDHAGLFGALAESEERFRRAFEDNAVGMVLTDAAGRAVRVNRAMRELVGRSEVELLGTALGELVTPTPASVARAAEAMELTRPGGGTRGSIHYEGIARHTDGRAVHLAVAVSAVRGANGTPVHLSVNLLDITQRRAAERDRRARREAEVARAAAEAASRAKSEFVSALNHELRTPLQAITGFTELLRTLDLPADRRRAALGHIEGATAHVLAMVDDLLDIAKIEADALPIHIEAVDLGVLSAEVLALLAPLAHERNVELGPATTPVHVLADRRRLRQVLINLVTNGVRYNRPGGTVAVTAQLDGSVVVIAVRDTGRGIPAEMLGRLFTPFDRLGAEGTTESGAGLGLVLAKTLTVAMGGTLEVTTAAGEGTTIDMRLPTANGTHCAPTPDGSATRRRRLRPSITQL
jgi:PAS domain S-box-containing protein